MILGRLYLLLYMMSYRKPFLHVILNNMQYYLLILNFLFFCLFYNFDMFKLRQLIIVLYNILTENLNIVLT